MILVSAVIKYFGFEIYQAVTKSCNFMHLHLYWVIYLMLCSRLTG